MPRMHNGRFLQSVRDRNISYVSGYLRQAFGGDIDNEELTFRWYFGGSSRSVSAANMRVMLGEMARDVLAAIRAYAERKAGYRTVVRNRASSGFQLPFDEGCCIDDIERLFGEARRNYLDLLEAHSVALHFKGREIPESIFDDHDFGGMRLYRELEEAVKIFEGPAL